MEDEYRTFIEGFGQVIIDRRWDDGAALMAPWLQASLGAEGLEKMVAVGSIPDQPPPYEVLEAGWNPSSIEELRDLSSVFDEQPVEPLSLEEYLAGSTRSTNILDVPRIAIASEITPENFRQWGMVMLAPDEDLEADVDYVIQLYLILVEVDGRLCLGHIEPEP